MAKHFSFDDPDGYDGGEPSGNHEGQWFEEEPPSAAEFQDEIEPFKFRRLYRKTRANDTNYSNTALVCRSDFKVLQHLKKRQHARAQSREGISPRK